MAIVPEGSPLWARTVDFAHYGGNVEKANYLSRGAIDALTDVDASQFARLTADLASVTRTAPFAVIRLLCDDTTPAAPTIEYVHMATGVRLTSYVGTSAPAGYPSAARNGNGDVTVTFASSYTDPYGVANAFTVSHVVPGVVGTAVSRCVAEIPTSTTVRLRAFDAADAALSNARINFMVW